ncbi:MAG: hypothetical protein ACJAT1_001666 [Marivirga sp.]|jgi:hypothetical protein
MGKEAYVVIEVQNETKDIDGKTYMVCENYMQTGDVKSAKVISTSYVRRTSDGTVSMTPIVSENELLMLPKSPYVGQIWDAEEMKAEVMSLEGSISAPIGDFSDCLIIKSVTAVYNVYTYYQKNIGLGATEMEADGQEKKCMV